MLSPTQPRQRAMATVKVAMVAALGDQALGRQPIFDGLATAALTLAIAVVIPLSTFLKVPVIATLIATLATLSVSLYLVSLSIAWRSRDRMTRLETLYECACAVTTSHEVVEIIRALPRREMGPASNIDRKAFLARVLDLPIHAPAGRWPVLAGLAVFQVFLIRIFSGADLIYAFPLAVILTGFAGHEVFRQAKFSGQRRFRHELYVTSSEHSKYLGDGDLAFLEALTARVYGPQLFPLARR